VSADVAQFTKRAVLTGMALGALLSLCNIYSGLKIGWGTNMSITAALLGYGLWRTAGSARPFGLVENTVSQTAASSGASVSSAGLVAPIPALAMLTGQTLPWHWLALWVFSVTCVGIVVALGLRRQMLMVDKLPFPMGIATAETLREMYARGSEAMARVKALLVTGAAAGALKLVVEVFKVSKLALPGKLALSSPALAHKGVTFATLKNLGFALDPSVLLFGVGGLIGMRACASLLIGAVAGWLVLAPYVLEQGWAPPGKIADDAVWFGATIKWMLWPGVALMVSSSLTSFAFSGKAIVAAFRGAHGAARSKTAAPGGYDFERRTFVRAIAAVLALSVVCQVFFYSIGPVIAIIGVLLTFLLAVVAARVAGETGITPVGPMGKVTQLIFGAISPGDATANLMAANVTGGAASQAGDLLHDMRAGLMVGAWPRLQAKAQLLGALSGALAGSAAYLVLVPDPAGMLLTKDWPAPAVAQWKAVAEVFQKGFDTMPPGSLTAIYIAGAVGVLLAIAERVTPPRVRMWVPSPASMGLAFVVPAYYSISMFLGGVAAMLSIRFFKSWSSRFLVVIASGMIAGESLMGVVFAVKKILAG
jgi:putative OPT family oligopeptide transporter